MVVSGVSTGSLSTRSTTLGNGSEIGISRIADGAYTAQSNYKYVNTSGTWSAATTSNILIMGKNNATLCAYSPYSSFVNVSSVPLTSNLYNSASDFCYGYTNGVNAINMGTGVSFTLDHAYAKLTLRFTKGSSFIGAGNVKKITVTGGARSAALNISSSSPSLSVTDATTPVSVGDGVTTIFNIVNTPSYDVDVLMVPSTISSGLTFTLNVDDINLTATLPSSLLNALAAKTNYTIPIAINSTSLDLGGASGTNYVKITDWTVPASVTNPLNDIPESNCYIVAPCGTILIPVSRATTGNAVNFPAGASFTCGLLWSDVSATHVTTTAVGRYIKVVAGSAEGNSVVYAMNSSNQIVWSWHIWVTNYHPGTTANTGTNTTTYQSANGLLWMDRNLGAIAVADGTNTFATCGGLFYQWGRKDPFPGSDGTTTGSTNIIAKSISVNVTPTKGTQLSNDNVYFYDFGPSDYANALSYSIQSPLTFFGKWAGSTAIVAAAAIPSNENGMYSWNSSTNAKTIYDPCPAGWRVPANGAWSALPSNVSMTKVNTVTAYDNFQPYSLGNYPASGIRNTFGILWHIGGSGQYWSATAAPYCSNDLFFGSLISTSAVYTSYNDWRSNGFSVRCVKN